MLVLTLCALRARIYASLTVWPYGRRTGAL